jgi:hypothetical protein
MADPDPTAVWIVCYCYSIFLNSKLDLSDLKLYLASFLSCARRFALTSALLLSPPSTL